MASGTLHRVDACGRDDFGNAFGAHPDGPLALVGKVVVIGADEAAVGKVGRTAVAPGGDVMGFGPGRWPVASGPDAALVAHREGEALVAGEEATLASQVEDR